MSTLKNKNSLRTIEAQIVQKLKNNEPRPKFTDSYKKKKKRVLQYGSTPECQQLSGSRLQFEKHYHES